jgi:hypothetical protein
LRLGGRAPAGEQEGAVATNKERLLARPREGERAGPAVQIGSPRPINP